MCGETLDAPYLDLGEQPLANALVDPTVPRTELTAPLAVARCCVCKLSQLTVTVDPAVLYAGYRFRSGASDAWRAHCETLVEQLAGVWPDSGTFVLDIAANDGTQLRACQRCECYLLGVEPADIPCGDLPMMREYWSMDVAQRIVRERGPASVVIAQNVLGHVDRPVEFLRAVRHVLDDDGVCVVEVPDVGELIHRTAFDTIYHEHLSYWGFKPMLRCVMRAGLRMVRVDPLDVHGGSRRYWLMHPGASIQRDPSFYEAALQLTPTAEYHAFAIRVERQLAEVRALLEQQQAAGQRIAAYGASAKGAVVLNALKARGNTVWPMAIFDDCEAKQGLRSPGTHLRIEPPPTHFGTVDTLWVLSWNNLEAIKATARARGFAGQFLVTSPTVRLEA